MPGGRVAYGSRLTSFGQSVGILLIGGREIFADRLRTDDLLESSGRPVSASVTTIFSRITWFFVGAGTVIQRLRPGGMEFYLACSCLIYVSQLRPRHPKYPSKLRAHFLWLVVLFVSVLQEGKVLPCVVILYLHPVVIGLWMIPYPLRGLKAVILSHKGGFARAVDVLSEHF